ncbi:MAG: hypothetical protein KA403_04275 [Candidatus Omnitrophica bacterium]|nr:hypothetical protein [Candidatus Omnitrophota bacterium]
MISRLRMNALVVLCAGMMWVASGCGVVIIAGLGALGGYVISPDTVEGIVGYSESELFAASGDVLSIMGSVGENSKSSGRISAVVSGARVTVDVIPQSKTSTKLRVKARKFFFPKMAVAQDVYMKVVRRLQE